MLALAAADGGIDIGVFQWLVGLGLIVGSAVTGLFVARALHGRALTQLEEWKTKMVKEAIPARLTAIESRVDGLDKADLIVRTRDLERTSKETESWRLEASEQLDHIEKVEYAKKEVAAALAESSTSRGTMPYRGAK